MVDVAYYVSVGFSLLPILLHTVLVYCMEVMEPQVPEDVYNTHLTGQQLPL